MPCQTYTSGIAKNLTITFCGDSLGIVRSVNGTSGVTLADITSLEDDRINNVAAHETATATVEIFGLDEDIPDPGSRGTLSITGDGVSYSEYLILENVQIQASVGEAVIYTATFQSAVDMSSKS